MLVNQLRLIGKSTQKKAYIKSGNGEKSKDDVMGTIDFTIPFTLKNWEEFGPHKLKVEVKGGVFDDKRILRGRTGEIEESGYELPVKFQDDGYQLKKTYSGEDYNDYIETVLKKIVGETEDLKLKLRDVKHEKISRTEVHGNTTGSGTCITGQSYPTSGCEQANYSLQSFSWDNYCPACGKTGTLRKAGHGALAYKGPPIGNSDCSGINCRECDSDYCPITGWETSGSCLYKLRKCGDPGSTTSTPTDTTSTPDTITEDSVDVESTTQEVEQPGTIEEELQAICSYKDYHMTVTQNQEVYIQSRYRPTKADFKVEKWMIKKNSFHYAVRPDPEVENIPTTAKVTYANGTIKVSIKELVEQRGEGTPLTDKQSKMNKVEATKHAWGLLFDALREMTLEISFEMLLTGSFSVGSWIEVPNPKFDSWDIYWVDNISMNLDPKSPYTMTVNGLYMPKKQESKGGSANLAGLDAIVKQEAKFATAQGVCSSADCFVKNGVGDCWADSEWVYNQLEANGIKARVMAYKGGGNRWNARLHAWVQYYNGSQWVQFPYAGAHVGDVGAGTPYVWVGPGRGNITGYLASIAGTYGK